ncbi:MAG: GGDEF domain-containing protein [Coriobacteriales bacterium]
MDKRIATQALPAEDYVLACCEARFAQSWRHRAEGLALGQRFIDGIAVLQLSADGASARAVLLGERFERLFGSGLRREEVQGNFFMLLARLDRPRFAQACLDAAAGEPVDVDVSWRIDCEDGGDCTEESYLSTRASLERVGERDGEPLLYLAVSNTSQRRHREHELRRLQFANSLGALFDEAFTLDLDTGVVEPLFSAGDADAACSCGCKRSGQRSKTGFYAYSRRVHKDDKQLFWSKTNTKQILRSLFGEQPCRLISFDLRVRDAEEGEGGALQAPYRWTSFAITRVATGDQRRVALVCVRNIDQQMDAMRRERELRSRAQLDSLTGIFNRGTTEELVTAAIAGWAPGAQCVLAVVDVDRFKQVNDSYGHLMGDKLLVEVAAALKAVCGEGDIAGRIGGDEFVLLMRGDLGEDFALVGQRLDDCRSRIAAFSAECGIEPAVTLSVGVVPVTEGDLSYRSLFERADEMLYSVKRGGRNGYRLYRP